MRRATFSSGSRPAGGRSLKKPALYLFGFCSLMVSAAALTERFFGAEGGGLSGLLGPSEAAAGDLARTLGLTNPDASGGSAQPLLITPTGELTPEQRAWLLEQARKGAPIPLDGNGRAVDAESQRQRKLERLGEALGQAGG